MQQELVDLYEKELQSLRKNGESFASAYPKIASRLKLGQGNVEDPLVGRLMESFAFLTSQIRVDLQQEEQRLTENMLQLLYPEYFLPLPSYTTVQFSPSTQLDKAYEIPIKTTISTPLNDKQNVIFSTGYSVEVLPVTVSHIEYQRVNDFQSANSQRQSSRAVLTLTLETQKRLPFSNLNCDSLRFFINSDPEIAGAWLTTLLTELKCIDIEVDCEVVATLHPGAISQVGFHEKEALLPYPANSFNGYRLLHEYFAYPERFQYIAINNLTIFDAIDADKVQLKFYTSTYHAELETTLEPSLFKLNCTPMINLFSQTAEPITYDQSLSEYHVVADSQCPTKFLEIYAVEKVSISSQSYRERIDSAPYYGRSFSQTSDEYLYWLPHRQSLAALGEYTTPGDEVFLQFQDSHINELDEKLTLTPKVLCTNRSAPEQLPYGGGQPGLLFKEGGHDLIGKIECIRPITATCYRDNKTMQHAELAAHFSLNQTGLSSQEKATEQLKQSLMLYAYASPFNKTMIEHGIVNVMPIVVTERHPLALRQGFCRGIEYQLILNDEAISPALQFLFGEVVHQFLSTLCSINTFVRLTIISQQRGEVHQWKAQLGKSNVL
jgi:type VI secretion system protein ImpG